MHSSPASRNAPKNIRKAITAERTINGYREITSTRTFALQRRCAASRNERGATPGQVALAWLLHKGNDIVPIPGTKRIQYLDENIGAAEVTLTAAEISELEGYHSNVAGPRYTAGGMKWIDRQRLGYTAAVKTST